MIHSAQYIFSVHDVNTNDVTYDYVKMADERDDAFIELWRGQPCLFDISCKAYSNKNEKIKAVEEIGQKLQMTPVAVNKKLTSLRTQYSRLVTQATSEW